MNTNKDMHESIQCIYSAILNEPHKDEYLLISNETFEIHGRKITGMFLTVDKEQYVNHLVEKMKERA